MALTVVEQARAQLESFTLMISDRDLAESDLREVHAKKTSFVQLTSYPEFFDSPFSVFTALGGISLEAANVAAAFLPSRRLASLPLTDLQQRIRDRAKQSPEVTQPSLISFTQALDTEMSTFIKELLAIYQQMLQMRRNQSAPSPSPPEVDVGRNTEKGLSKNSG